MSLSVGAHLRNEPLLQARDSALYATMRGRFVTAFWYQSPGAVIDFAGGADRVICRLPDTFQFGRVLGLGQLQDDYQTTLDRWYQAGVRLFVLDNEPNESWKNVVPPQGQTVAQQWAWLMRRILRGVAVPSQATLLLTPISLPTLPENDPWLTAMVVPEAGFPAIRDYCAAAAAHCYWQASGDMDAEWAGRSYQFIHDEMCLPVYITEAGCSTQTDTENRQAADYPVYCGKVAADDYVKALTFFILGSNRDWTLFNITNKVAAAIGSRVGA